MYLVLFETTPSKSSFNLIWGSNTSSNPTFGMLFCQEMASNGPLQGMAPTMERFPSRWAQVWRSVPLHISRKRVRLMAPGICSYVAASCGGAVGRLCLTIEEDQSEQDEDGPQGPARGRQGGGLGAALGGLLDSSTDGETEVV